MRCGAPLRAATHVQPRLRFTIIESISIREGHMRRTRVSPKYQVVIPKEIREQVRIHPGQEFQVIAKGGIISFVPDRPISSMRGFVKGIKTTGFREKKDR